MDKLLNWSFVVHTEPVAKARPRAVRRGNHVAMYTPPKTVKFEEKIYKAALAVIPTVIDFPVRVDILAVFQRPKRLERKKDPQQMLWKDSRPDSDNVRKAVLDGLDGILADDSLVVDGRTLKCYGAKGQKPLVRVAIRQVEKFPDATDI